MMRKYIERELLSDGEILVILRVGRQYTCYAVNPNGIERPAYFTYRGTLAECRKSFADVLEQECSCES